MKNYAKASECYYEHDIKIKSIEIDKDIDAIEISYWCKDCKKTLKLVYTLKEIDIDVEMDY